MSGLNCLYELGVISLVRVTKYISTQCPGLKLRGPVSTSERSMGPIAIPTINAFTSKSEIETRQNQPISWSQYLVSAAIAADKDWDRVWVSFAPF